MKPRQPAQSASLSVQVPNPAQETEENEKTRRNFRPLLKLDEKGFFVAQKYRLIVNGSRV
jgi:hypothetical protein